MAKNILSIDFDIIMYPCINLYNDKVSGGESAAVTWDRLEKEMNLKQFLTYDSKTYTSLVKCVQLATANGAKLIPVTEHDEIVKKLKADEEYDNTTYNVVNIDHHHDLFYRQQDISAVKRFDRYNCSNWFGYLLLNNKVEEATWVKAPNSFLPDFRMLPKDTSIDLNIQSLDCIESLNDTYKFDEVYLCFSPQWVPYEYKHLYDLIIILFGGK